MPNGQKPFAPINYCKGGSPPHPIKCRKIRSLPCSMCSSAEEREKWWRDAEVGEGIAWGESVVWKEEDPTQRFPIVSTRAKAPSPLTNALVTIKYHEGQSLLCPMCGVERRVTCRRKGIGCASFKATFHTFESRLAKAKLRQ